MTSGERDKRRDRPTIDLELLRPILRESWGADTCDPHDLQDWHPDNPARGQCGVTALIVQDLLGGELVLGEVFVEDAKVGHHYWNRLPDGHDVDLTAEQFHPQEAVVGARVQQRPPGTPRRCRRQYEILRQRVLSALDGNALDGSPAPAHIVTAFIRDGDRVLLCHRTAQRLRYPDLWDLPGGHVDPGELPHAAIARELREEVGIEVAPPTGPPMYDIRTDAFHMQIWLFETWSGTPTNVAPDEHDAVAWFARDELAELRLVHAEHHYQAMFTKALSEHRA